MRWPELLREWKELYEELHRRNSLGFQWSALSLPEPGFDSWSRGTKIPQAMQQSQNKTNNKQNKKQSPPRTKQKYPPSKKHPKTQNNQNPNEYHPGTMGINWMLLGHLGCTVSWIQGWNPYQASQELRPYTVLAEEPGWARGSLGISVIQLKVKLLVSSTCLRDPLGVVYFCYGIATPDSSPWGGRNLPLITTDAPPRQLSPFLSSQSSSYS